MTSADQRFRYQLVVPDEWFAVELDPRRRDGSVRALVNRQFAGIDNAPHLKAQARLELTAKAEAAYDAGGLDMFLSMQQLAGIPLAASLVVFVIPAPRDGSKATAEQMAESLRDGDREVSVIGLPAGMSVRVFRRATAGEQPGGDSASLEVFVPVPGTGAWLLLSFSVPLGPLVPAMTKLFDAICTTLRWNE
jgi:hypothetical protein